MVEFPPIAHVAVTVRDIERSKQWYGALIGSEPVLDEDTGPFHHVVWMIGGTLLGIHQHAERPVKNPASEFDAGLDHVAFGCARRSDLDAWETRLNELGIRHGGIVDAPYGSGLSFRDPDNIPLEFFAPPNS